MVVEHDIPPGSHDSIVPARLHYQAFHIGEVFPVHLNTGCNIIILLLRLCFLWEVFLEEDGQILVDTRYSQISIGSGH